MKNTKRIKKRSTMEDVARMAGVTIGTVSHVINGTATISAATTARVKEAIEKLNYIPNVAAQNMRRKENRQLGLLVPKLTNMFYSEMANAIMGEADKEHYTMMICGYEYSLEQEKKVLYNLLQNNVKTIIIANGHDDEEYIRELVGQGVHVILADRRSSEKGVSYVAYNNVETAEKIVGFLKERGYERIGFISEPLVLNNLWDRFVGYKAGLEKYGYPYREEYVHISEKFRHGHAKNGYFYMKKLLKDHKREELPNVFMVSSDMLAIGVIKAIGEAGYRIPEDFGIIACDNLEISAYLQPPLTTIKQDQMRLAQELWKQVTAYRTGKRVKNIMLEQELVVRGSC
jgi:DNA-binding LacI/PurR family transcriptional regulator